MRRIYQKALKMKKKIQQNNKDLQRAIERLHNCRASYIEDVIVVEKFGLDTAWEGIVAVFDLQNHPTANRAYAWSHEIEGSKKRKYYAVLHQGKIDSPEKAVRAAIVQDAKSKSVKKNKIF